MFKAGSTIFLNIPSGGSSRRELHRGSVFEFSSGGVTIAMDEADLGVSPGQNAFIYFDRRQTFMQQAATIQAVFYDGKDADDQSPNGSTPSADRLNGSDGGASNSGAAASNATTKPKVATQLLVGLQVTGEPVSADSRATYRVVTAISGGITATLEDTIECPVLDVSATGFSVVCDTPLRMGQVVRVNMQHENNSFQGTAIVQSIKQLSRGQNRYGMHCAGDEKSNGSLHRGLQRTSAAIQREQLRRASGND